MPDGRTVTRSARIGPELTVCVPLRAALCSQSAR
jgi:hypothetical protein